MSTEPKTEKDRQHINKNLKTEISRASFLSALAATAREEKFTNYFLSGAWTKEYVSRLPDGDFFAGFYLTDGTDSEESIAYFSRGTRSSPMSGAHISLGFNEATTAEFDSITTEYNGMLCNPSARFAHWIPTILSYLTTIPHWDELRFNALTSADALALQQAAANSGLLSHIYSHRKTYLTDLAFINNRYQGDFLASRSANTRQQIRNSIKKIETAFGPLELSRAASADIAHRWFDALGELHSKRWNSESELTRFADSHFVQFHNSLIDCLFESGQIDVLRVMAGDTVVAYLYNFAVGNTAYFNMSGVNYDSLAAYRPGILAHYKAILFYQANGMHTYNFLAGTHRYKESLATHSEEQTNIILRRPRLKFRIEAVLRRIKRFFSNAAE